MSDIPGHAAARPAEALAKAAQAEFEAGRYGEAVGLLQSALAIRPGHPALWLNLAQAQQAAGRLPEALAAVDQVLERHPRGLRALLLKAELLSGQHQMTAAARYWSAAVEVAGTAQVAVDSDLMPALEQAARRLQEWQQALAAHLEGALGAAVRDDPGMAATRAREFAARISGLRRVYRQEPTELHYPGLPELGFHPGEHFPWLRELENATPDIRAELEARIAEAPARFTPYISYPPGTPLDQWTELNRSPRWSALHLVHYGAPVPESAGACPRTMQALGLLPQPVLRGRTPAAMFSALQPHTHIPPHTGVANIRLVVHLPLIVPEGCRFRVGNEIRPWKEGKAWVFDDTIEHEAWNDSDQLRVVLIADIWNPALSIEERALIARTLEAVDGFAGGSADMGL